MKLLVSVKDIGELKIALSSNVDIIDLKDPEKGPLAAVSPQIAVAAAKIVESSRPNLSSNRLESLMQLHPQSRKRFNPILSLAMGELKDTCANAISPSYLAGFSFAKVGLAGMATAPQWPRKWSAWALSLPPTVSPVLVGYADWKCAQSPPLDAVVDMAMDQQVSFLLIDTFGKDGKNLLDHLTINQLQTILAPLRSNNAHQTHVALAGSVGISHLPRLVNVNPEIIAVRGSVCENADRKTKVSKQLIDRLSSEIRNICERTQKQLSRNKLSI